MLNLGIDYAGAWPPQSPLHDVPHEEGSIINAL
jgi:hypothetical protein